MSKQQVSPVREVLDNLNCFSPLEDRFGISCFEWRMLTIVWVPWGTQRAFSAQANSISCGHFKPFYCLWKDTIDIAFFIWTTHAITYLSAGVNDNLWFELGEQFLAVELEIKKIETTRPRWASGYQYAKSFILRSWFKLSILNQLGGYSYCKKKKFCCVIYYISTNLPYSHLYRPQIAAEVVPLLPSILWATGYRHFD